MPAASITSVPNTREVKNPRESPTTIGVLPMASTKSYAFASAASDVCSPTMISTSGILSTGEKKCRPQKSARRCTPSASPVIGSVDVFEHSSASAATADSVSPSTRCLSAASSKTASITRSHPARSSSDAVGVMRASSASRCSTVPRLLLIALSSRDFEYALPLSARARSVSLSTTSMPALAVEYAMPAPIMPAPSTATRDARHGAGPAGREPPAVIACRSKKKAWVMSLNCWWQIRSTR